MYEILLALFFSSIIISVVSMFKMWYYLVENRIIKNSFKERCYRWDFPFVYQEETKDKKGKAGIWFYLSIFGIWTGFLSFVLIKIFY